MKKIIVLMLTLLTLVACSNTEKKNVSYDIRAVIKTNKGDINLYLYPEEEGAPLTVLNFVNLAQRGFYDGLTFHRVVEKFVIQGGDPKGDGTGGPGYQFKNEIALDWLNFYDSGMLAMANSGPDTNGSQFFITLNETTSLNGSYTIFGEVVDNADQKIVEKIKIGDTINTIQIVGNTSWLYAKYKDQVDEWNKILDEQGFSDKRKAATPVMDTTEKIEE